MTSVVCVCVCACACACACACLGACVRACVRAFVRACMCKTSCQKLGEIDLSIIYFEETFWILVYIQECMLQTNHILDQSKRTY